MFATTRSTRTAALAILSTLTLAACEPGPTTPGAGFADVPAGDGIDAAAGPAAGRLALQAGSGSSADDVEVIEEWDDLFAILTSPCARDGEGETVELTGRALTRTTIVPIGDTMKRVTIEVSAEKIDAVGLSTDDRWTGTIHSTETFVLTEDWGSERFHGEMVFLGLDGATDFIHRYSYRVSGHPAGIEIDDRGDFESEETICG